MNEDIEILKISRVSEGEKDIRGFAEVRLGLVVIKNISIYERDGQLFCGLPREKYWSHYMGKIMWRAIIHIADRDLKTRLYKAILQEFSSTEDLKFRGEMNVDQEEKNDKG